MTSIAKERLLQERKVQINYYRVQQWSKDHPHGFYARPIQNEDSTLNLFKWEAGIPGKEKVRT